MIPGKTADQDLLTAAESAELAGVSLRTFYRDSASWTPDGWLDGRTKLYRRRRIEQYRGSKPSPK